jgi:hypothetical protein
MPTPERDNANRRFGDGPIHAYRPWMVRFWHGMSAPAWWRLVKHDRFAVDPSRWYIASSIDVMSVLNSIGRGLQEMLMGHVARRTKLAEPPLFVLGHWRSGTTLMHELLIRDPANTYPNTYECFSPHHFLVTEPFVTPFTRWLLPAKRPMDEVETGWDRPQEDEFALCNLGLPSPYLVWAFPNNGPVHENYLDLSNLTSDERERWKRALFGFVQNVATVRNRRIVLKSPPHTARIRTLLEIFPDARFVHLVRDPLSLFPSTVRLWRSLSEVQGLQAPTKLDEWLEESVFTTLQRMYAAFERDRQLVPPGHLVDVRYEDLIADPKREMRRVYEELGLGDFRRVEPGIDRYLAEQKDYRTNRYQLPPEIESQIRDRWRGYFERYGYSKAD